MIRKLLFVHLCLVAVASAESKVAFSAEKDLPIDAMPALMIPVDFDKDGDVDVLVHAIYGEFTWLDNQGNGKFSKRVIDAKFETGGLAGYVTYGDVDGDKDLDVIASSDNGTVGSLSWFENLGGGKAFTQHMIQKNGRGSIGVGDVDGDQKLDVVFAAESGPVKYFRNLDGKGAKWGEAKEIFEKDLKEITVADFNKDGRPDILGYRNQDLTLLLNEKASFKPLVVKGELDFTDSEYKPVDLNQDGFLDLVITTGWEIQVLENVGGKAFSANAVAPKVSTKAYYAVDGADLDGDKDIDIVVTGGLKVSWWENLGSNKFAEHDIKTYEQTMSGAAFAVDLNRDGKPDFLSKRWGAGATFVWYQNGAEAAATGSTTKGGSTKPPKKQPRKR